LPAIGKMASYVEQACVHAREQKRTTSYIARADSVLSAELLVAVDTEQPARLQRTPREIQASWSTACSATTGDLR
jgi:hypothetical protein